MKHTPGPWIIEERTQKPYPNAAEENFLFINGDDASDVCRMMRIGGDTVIANARLIAAAPELLEACKDALTEIQRIIAIEENNECGPSLEIKNAESALIAAIAKAEGK